MQASFSDLDINSMFGARKPPSHNQETLLFVLFCLLFFQMNLKRRELGVSRIEIEYTRCEIQDI